VGYAKSTCICCLCFVAGWIPMRTPAAESDSAAEKQPLWEFGLGIGALALDDYRGSDTGRVYPIPIPYLIYRGQFLRSDRDGVRGVILDGNVVEFNVSVNATTPVESNNIPARAGMPDLRPTVEAGPSVDWHIWRSEEPRVRLDFILPLRTAVTIQDPPQSIGWFFAPRLNVDFIDIGAHTGWNLGMLAGPLFATRRYDQYFYSVAPEYARPGRAAYDASGGFAGTEFLTSLSKRFRRFWVGAFIRYDNLSGASFADSPLVRSNSYLAGGIGFAWMIAKSSTMVDVGDAER
jgi:outer membrane protein